MNKAPLFGYLLRIPLVPAHITRLLVGDPLRLRYGTLAWLTLSILYTLVAFIGYWKVLAPL